MRLPSISSKKVLIIGAGSYSLNNPSIIGIGTSIVKEFGKNNYDVFFTCNKNLKGANRLKGELRQMGFEKTSYLKFNAANYKTEFKKLRQRIIAWGNPDILVYCAGQRFYKEKLTLGEKLLTRKVNYDCPRHIINQILKTDTRFNPKVIIIISSMLAGKKHKYLQEYCDSKELINMYIKKIASKFEGTAFFSVCPGITLTPMTEERSTLYRNMVTAGKLNKILNSSEVAKLVCQISKNSKYKSGSRIFIGDV